MKVTNITKAHRIWYKLKAHAKVKAHFWRVKLFGAKITRENRALRAIDKFMSTKPRPILGICTVCAMTVSSDDFPHHCVDKNL